MLTRPNALSPVAADGSLAAGLERCLAPAGEAFCLPPDCYRDETVLGWETEAIFRRKETGEEALPAASRGASEVGQAVIASTLTTVAVFIPVLFLEGVAAQLFRDMAMTVSFSLLASLAVAR